MTADSLMRDGEHYRLISQQAKRLPNRPAASTVWRWATKGTRGEVLDSKIIGGQRYVSDEAMDRFLTALNEPQQAAPAKTPRSRRQRSESKKRAAEILAARGI